MPAPWAAAWRLKAVVAQSLLLVLSVGNSHRHSAANVGHQHADTASSKECSTEQARGADDLDQLLQSPPTLPSAPLAAVDSMAVTCTQH